MNTIYFFILTPELSILQIILPSGEVLTLDFLGNLVEYFSSGTNKEKKKNLGIEVEHFIVHKNSLKAVSYYGEYGVKYILEQLIRIYENPEPIFDKDLIGFSTDDFNVTLEPSAQIEISINPFENIENIENIYKNFLKKVESVLLPLGYKILSVGLQPISKAKNMTLIPKKRYEFMSQYFHSIGTDGINMMNGTCSTQVSIDYFSEADFRRKFQAAYLFTPVFKLISNNSTYFEGKKLKTFLKRTEIYNNTDPARCSVPEKLFSPCFGFKDYAEYLIKVPPIFIVKSNNEYIYTGKSTAKKVFEEKNISKEDVLHMVSIVFPDVRLKNYIEIRGADSMPIDSIMAYCALVKALIYSENILNWCQNFIKENKITVESLSATEKSLINLGWNGTIYNIPAKKFSKKIINMAVSNLNSNEQKYLSTFL